MGDPEVIEKELLHMPVTTELRRKSNYLPLESRGNFKETFYELNTLNGQQQVVRGHGNLNRKEMRALKELSNNENIIIKKADGGGMVIMDVEYYLEAAANILKDTDYYPRLLFKRKFNYFINEAYDQQILTKNERDFILIESPATPYLYFLPKLHKNPLRPPCRPNRDMLLLSLHI